MDWVIKRHSNQSQYFPSSYLLASLEKETRKNRQHYLPLTSQFTTASASALEAGAEVIPLQRHRASPREREVPTLETNPGSHSERPLQGSAANHIQEKTPRHSSRTEVRRPVREQAYKTLLGSKHPGSNQGSDFTQLHSFLCLTSWKQGAATGLHSPPALLPGSTYP